MTRSRHKAAKQHSPIRTIAPAVAAVAVIAAGTAITVQMTDNAQENPSAQSDASTPTDRGSGERTTGEISRGGDRESIPRSAEPTESGEPAQRQTKPHSGGGGKPVATEESPEPAGTMYVTTALNVRTGPSEQHDVVTTLPTGSKVTVTDNTEGSWAEILYEGEAHWVTAEYLAEDKPEETESDETEPDETDPEESEPEGTGGLSDSPCPSGSAVESGLTPDAILVHRAVCAEFPAVTSYGGLRPGDDGEHGTGQALDIMIPSSTVGDQIAEFVRAHASDLGVSEVLWQQHIWTVQRAAEGWRPMEDRGSPTANHYDHVHVTVYGTSAG